MNQEGNPTPGRTSALEFERSPLLPQHLVDLFIRPRHFFSGQLALGKTPYAVLIGWCYGAASSIERIDSNLLRAEMDHARPGWDQLAPYIVESWPGFWAYVLVSGALAGLALWWLGGWWFTIRLRWSGANDPDRRMARLVMIYSAFVQAGPTVLGALIETAEFSSYAEAHASDEPFSLLLLIFPFWSIAASYSGVRSVFRVSGWRPRLWFLVLPVVVYLMLFGVVATLVALVGDTAI